MGSSSSSNLLQNKVKKAETLEKGVIHIFKVNNENTKKTAFILLESSPNFLKLFVLR